MAKYNSGYERMRARYNALQERYDEREKTYEAAFALLKKKDDEIKRLRKHREWLFTHNLFVFRLWFVKHFGA